MSYYAAGSPGGYIGMGTYLQEGHPLSYAPRFSGGVYSAAGSPGGYHGGVYSAAGSPGGYRGLGAVDPEIYEQYRAAGMSHEAAMKQAESISAAQTAAAKEAAAKAAAEKEAAASAGMWTGLINTVLQAGTSIYQMSAQQRLIKQQQHQAARDREAQLQLARTQSMYIKGGSIVPAQGSSVMMSAVGRRGAMSPVMLIGGLALAGGAAWFFMRGRKRR